MTTPINTREYIVAGWITVHMTDQQAEQWNAGTLDHDECMGLLCYTCKSAGPLKSLAERIRDGEIAEDDLTGEHVG
jgi:hypothetical protein